MGRVNLEPAAAEIRVQAVHVVVVVVTLAHHQDIHRKEVAGSVVHIVVAVAVLMGEPVDDCAVQGAHDEIDRQEEEHPPGGSEPKVEACVNQGPEEPR